MGPNFNLGEKDDVDDEHDKAKALAVVGAKQGASSTDENSLHQPKDAKLASLEKSDAWKRRRGSLPSCGLVSGSGNLPPSLAKSLAGAGIHTKINAL